MNFPKLLAALLVSCSMGANAASITFNLEYSGESFFNGATATGSITFDDALLPNEDISLFGVSGDVLGVVAFELTVAGASSGNGTFGLSALGAEGGRWVWSLDQPVDLTTELVGQAGFADFNWLCGINGASCEGPLVPQGVAVFTLLTAGGEELLLTSMTPVPVPGAVWLFASALLGLARTSRARPAIA